MCLTKEEWRKEKEKERKKKKHEGNKDKDWSKSIKQEKRA